MLAKSAVDEADTIELQMFGRFRVRVGGRPLEDTLVRYHTAMRLLKLLALVPGHRLHREQTIEWLWPELEAKAATNRLHRTLYTLRRILEPNLADGKSSVYVRFAGDMLVLCPLGRLRSDVDAFEAAVAAAFRDRDVASYTAALDVYTGDLLPDDLYIDWIISRREHLRHTYLRLLLELARLYEAQASYVAAIETIQRVVASEPTHEDAHVRLMRLYMLLGQRHQGLRQYQQLREGLRRELDIEPSETSRRLYLALLAGPVLTGRLQQGGDGVPTNLPNPVSSFTGREQEINQLRSLLATTRLLTLTGAGGCGKTRLALEVAARVQDQYPQGVWLIELATLTDPRLLPQAVASAIGVSETPGQPLLPLLIKRLHQGTVLLVLDNCEHLVNVCADVAGRLLTACPQLQILATSRESLRVAGETTWRVPSLSLPAQSALPSVERLRQFDGIRLFTERARASRPEFQLTPENAPAVAQICQRLDGIPLAIELAAARVTVLPVEQIAARLDDCLGLLAGGSRTVLPRHQALRATTDWSYRLLEELEQVLFRRLSVFAGGWTLEAAEVVGSRQYAEVSGQQRAGNEAGGYAAAPERGTDRTHEPRSSLPAGVLSLLARLVDKSLVVMEERAGQPRYRMLEIVRQYAAEHLLTAEEAPAVRRCHALWALALAEAAEPELMGPQQAASLARLETEHDNLRAALRWATETGELEIGLRLAGALWRFWYVRGHLSEGQRWLHALLSRPSAVAATVRAKALTGAGMLAYSLGQQAQAATLHEESLQLYQSAEDTLGTATALHNLGIAAHYQGSLARAAALFEESLTLRRQIGDAPGMAASLHKLGNVSREQGYLARAAALFEESLDLWRQLGDIASIALSLNSLGRLSRDRGNYEHARALHEESLHLYHDLQDDWHIAITLHSLAVVAHLQNDLVHATVMSEESLTLRRRLGDNWGIAASLDVLGRVARQLGDLTRAARLSGESLALRRQLGDTWGVAIALNALAEIARDRGDHKQAASLFNESLSVFQKVHNMWGIAACLDGLASVAHALGQPERGAHLCGAATSLRETIGAPRPPVDRATFDRTVTVLETALGRRAFWAAWTAGWALPLDQAITEALAIQQAPAPAAAASHALHPLSRREREIATLLARGLTNRQIAAELGITRRTADTHVGHILRKLGLSSRAQIAARARRQQG